MITYLLVMAVLFLVAWNIVLMLDNATTNRKIEQMCADLWDTMACKQDKVEADANEYTNLNARDTLFTADYLMRQDFTKSVTNITALARILGYQWDATGINGTSVPGHWAKLPVARGKKAKTGFEQYCEKVYKEIKPLKSNGKVSVKK